MMVKGVLPVRVQIDLQREGERARLLYRETFDEADREAAIRALELGKGVFPGARMEGNTIIMEFEGSATVCGNIIAGEALMWSNLGDAKLRDLLVAVAMLHETTKVGNETRL